jgi:hypothetical protein
MTSRQHQLWISRGKPFRLARPLTALRDVLRAAGYTVYDIGNTAHLDAQPPEDHTPYSETGWPTNPAPYGVGCAIDVMPPPAGSGLPSLQVLGKRLFDDRQAGRAGFIKYMNWGPVDDRHAVQDRWKPDHVRGSSSDTGHAHISSRTDVVDSAAWDGYNPLITGGFTMADSELINNAERGITALVALTDPIAFEHPWNDQAAKGYRNPLVQILAALKDLKATPTPVVVRLDDAQLPALAKLVAAELRELRFVPGVPTP